MASGLFIAFEGIDGAGKTTVMQGVASRLLGEVPEIVQTRHPGSTPLGAHLRQLVKYPQSFSQAIVLDPLTRQLLYLADAAAFVEQILKPSLADNKIVFADRHSFLSCLAYGMAEGIAVAEIVAMYRLAKFPKADRLYVLRCPWEIGRKRLSSRQDKRDYFDNRPPEIAAKIARTYNELFAGNEELLAAVATGIAAVDDIITVDATDELGIIIELIVSDVLGLCKDKM